MEFLNQIICGDCLEVMPLLPDNSVDMILCDLPYGTTRNKWDCIIDLEKLWHEYKRVSKGVIVLTAQSPFDKVLGMSNLPMLKYEWIWVKEAGSGFLNAKIAPLKNHENVLIFYEKQPTYNPQMRMGYKPYACKQGQTKSNNYGKQTGAVTVSDGQRYPLTVLRFNRDKNKLHPTQKPVALFEYLVKTYTNEGDIILDNCIGSGTTAVACINTNRQFIGIDISDEYCDIARKRVEDANG